MFDNWKLELILLANVGLSAVLGFIIGFERKIRSKDAGIRTHAILCVGSALLTCLSKYGFGNGDPGRIAAQIVTGVGFLGAGLIVFRKYSVHGLTTAAGIWATSGVGVACGAGMYIVAVGAALIMILVQVVLHLPIKAFKQKKIYRLKIVFEETDNERALVKQLFGVESYNKLIVTRESENSLIYQATLNTETEYSSEFLDSQIKEHPFIRSIERVDNE